MKNETNAKPSYMISAAALNRCVDATGVVNLTTLHDLVIAALWQIEGARAGSGRRTRRSTFRLSKHVEAFLARFGYLSPSAARWFWDQPHAEFSLQLHAEAA